MRYTPTAARAVERSDADGAKRYLFRDVTGQQQAARRPNHRLEERSVSDVHLEKISIRATGRAGHRVGERRDAEERHAGVDRLPALECLDSENVSRIT